MNWSFDDDNDNDDDGNDDLQVSFILLCMLRRVSCIYSAKAHICYKHLI